MKLKLLIYLILSFFISSAQVDENPPAFLDPKIDTIAFVNCSQETIDTLITFVRRNPKFVIDHNISCKAKVFFIINKNFSIETLVRDEDGVDLNIVFKDKVSKKYADKIRKYYADQARDIARSLYGIFIPKRVNGEYSPTEFYLNIDFTKNAGAPDYDSLQSKEFNAQEFSSQTVYYNQRLRLKGIEMLKKKKPELAFIYFRMAYFINKDIESVVLLGNLWDVMGEPKTACLCWKRAAESGNKQAESLIKKCSN